MKISFKGRLYLACFFFLLPFLVKAQDKNKNDMVDTVKNWRLTGLAQLNINQVALSNWQGGGLNTMAGAGFLHVTADYSKKQHSWSNKLDMAYGLIRQGGKANPFVKSDDELKLLSQYSRKLKGDWNYSSLLNFQTTFAPGYKYGMDSSGVLKKDKFLSKFMAPAFAIVSLGFEYKPNDNFFLLLAPVSGKFTFLFNDSIAAMGTYGVIKGKKFRAEIGANLHMLLKVNVMKNVRYETDLSLFSNYKTLAINTIDGDWQNQLILKANDIFSAKIAVHMIYDHDILLTHTDGSVGPGLQLKEAIDIGVQWKFW